MHLFYFYQAYTLINYDLMKCCLFEVFRRYQVWGEVYKRNRNINPVNRMLIPLCAEKTQLLVTIEIITEDTNVTKAAFFFSCKKLEGPS